MLDSDCDKCHVRDVISELCPQRVRMEMCRPPGTRRIRRETRDLGLIATRPNESPGGRLP